MKKNLLVIGCVVSMAALCMAQDKCAGGRPEQPEFRGPMGAGILDGEFQMMPAMLMNKELGLSQEQHQKIKDILSGSAEAKKALHNRMETAARTQVELMGQDSPDEAAVLKGVDDIADIGKEIARIRIKQLLEVQKILTPEQRSKMREKMKEKMKERTEKRTQVDKRKGKEFRKEQGKPEEGSTAGSQVAPPSPKAP